MMYSTARGTALRFRGLQNLCHSSKRYYATSREPDLKTVLREAIPAKRELHKKLRSEYGETVVGHVKVKQLVGGMRDIPGMVWEGSSVDPDSGVAYHGIPFRDALDILPRGTSGSELAVEGLFWLILTGKLPSKGQVRQLSRQLAEQSRLPAYVEKMLDELPTNVHPMAQLSAALTLLNRESVYASAYESGLGLDEASNWERMFDDAISLVGKIPVLAARIYRNAYRGGGDLPADVSADRDWAHNYAAMLGWDGKDNVAFQDMLRIHLAGLADHEGGNVSAHTTHLVASALGGPFIAVGAGISGMAGPRHGLAAQEGLRYILRMREAVGPSYTAQDVEAYLWQTLRSGKLVHGYGHGVLRVTDPRFTALMELGAAREAIARDDVFRLVQTTFEVAPRVLQAFGKSKCIYPNVDAASGVLYRILGLSEERYWCVPLGVARALGTTAQLVWDRALRLPIERPRSMTMTDLLAAAAAAATGRKRV